MKSALVSIALLSAVFVAPVEARPLAANIMTQPAERPSESFQRLVPHGVTSIGTAREIQAATAPSSGGLEIRPTKRGHSAADIHPAMFARNFAAANVVAVPSANGRRVEAPDPGFFGFAGLTHYDQRTAGTGVYAGTQYSLEPPDQGLCVGNGLVMEPVNNALAVYTQGGALLRGPTPMNAFFGLAPEIVRPSGPYGPSLSDPRCYFDRDTQRWYVSELETGRNRVTGAATGEASQFIAISQTADPKGAFNVLSFDTTDRGHPGCPCFGDQPLLGADANGIYITTNEFPQFKAGFNGAQVYALSKIALALGILPTVVHLDLGTIATPDPAAGLWYSVQPATTPELRRDHQEQNGTEYFLSALDFFNRTDNRIATWSLTNTATLWNPRPSVKLAHVVIGSEAYGAPPNATQGPGPRPLGKSLDAPLELLQTNDDRMNQVVFAQGRLWAGLNTALFAAGKLQAGSAFFAVEPSLAAGKLTAKVAYQGYVAVDGQNVIFPSIGVNGAGDAVLVSTLTGPAYYPSVAYVRLNRPNYNVRLAGKGVLPEDGFTGYPAYGGSGAARWGDYSAAVSDEHGNLWFAGEYIPGGSRTLLANWGTFVGELPAP